MTYDSDVIKAPAIERTRYCERCDAAHPESSFPPGQGAGGFRRYCRASEKPRGRPKSGGRRRVRVGDPAAMDAACDACTVIPATRAGGCKLATWRTVGGALVGLHLCPTCRSTAVAALGNAHRLRLIADAIDAESIRADADKR